MEKEKNKALESKEIDSSELDKIAGGNLVKVEYSYHTYGSSGEEEKKTTTGYYLPKNGNFYRSFEVASETDKALGGSGEVISTTKYENYFPPAFSDGWGE